MPERTVSEALRGEAERPEEKRGSEPLLWDAPLTKALEGAWAEDEHAVLSEAIPKNDAGVRPPGPLFPWMPAILVFFLGLGLCRAWIELVFVTPTFLFPAAGVATHDMYDIVMSATLLACAALYKRLNPCSASDGSTLPRWSSWSWPPCCCPLRRSCQSSPCRLDGRRWPAVAWARRKPTSAISTASWTSTPATSSWRCWRSWTKVARAASSRARAVGKLRSSGRTGWAGLGWSESAVLSQLNGVTLSFFANHPSSAIPARACVRVQ